MAPSFYQNNIYEFLSHREEGNSKENRKNKTFHRFLQAKKLPSTLQEHCLNTEHHDKVFVTYWLNPHQAIIGTKCNRLYIVHVDTGKKVDIPLIGIKESRIEEEEKERFSRLSSLSRSSMEEEIDSSSTSRTTTSRGDGDPHLSRQRSLHHSSSSIGRTTFNRRSTNTYRNDMGNMTFEFQEINNTMTNNHTINSNNKVNHAGIHSISVNPSGTWMATGAMESCHIGIYRLPSFQPFSVCLGHTDWLFATEWLSDTILVSGSRDSSLAIWEIIDNKEEIDDESLLVLRPKMRCIKHQGKVRDLKYNRKTKVSIESIR